MGTFRLVKPFIEKYKYYLILYTICILLAYPLEAIIIPKIFSTFFDSIKETSDNQNSNEIFSNFYKQIIIFMFIIFIAHTMISKLDIYLIPEFNESVSNIFYENILTHYENNYTDLELGRILSRINGLPSVLREMSTDLFNWISPKICTILIINCYFYMNNIKLGVLSSIILILIIYINKKSLTKCSILSHDRYLSFEDKSETLQDKLSNLYSIYSAGNVKEEIINFNNINRDFKKIHRKTIKCSQSVKNSNSLISGISLILLSCFILYLYKSNDISKKTLVILLMVLMFYIPCLNTIITYLPDYINHIGMITNVDNFIDTISVKNKIKPNIIINNGKIDIINLSFGYIKDNQIFTNFNLKIEPQTKVAIIGPSGNGKSTLIKLLMGYYEVPENTIFIDGQDINKFNLNSIRNQITYINQNTKLFNKTIYENIKYGNNISTADIIVLYNMFNLDRIFKNLPNGFNTIVGVNGDSLSGGQKQIVLLLRNSFKKNKICILDEPTSALDNETRKTVIQIIKRISKKSTLIIITHDENNLELVNDKILLLNGQIA